MKKEICDTYYKDIEEHKKNRNNKTCGDLDCKELLRAKMFFNFYKNKVKMLKNRIRQKNGGI